MWVAEDGQHVLTSLADQDAADGTAAGRSDPELLAGPFAHVVVDEAQELTDAEWQMLLLRCPSRSFTVVGDRAQARHGFPESWRERLQRTGLTHVGLATLSVNHRTPREVMVQAEPVIRAVLPDANVPTSIRSRGLPVVHGSRSELSAVLDSWLAGHAGGTACVVGEPTSAPTARVRSLCPELTKSLEFDLVVLVDPEAFGTGVQGAVDRYVAMTRATSQLVVLTSR
jgi:DNA helicase IV